MRNARFFEPHVSSALFHLARSKCCAHSGSRLLYVCSLSAMCRGCPQETDSLYMVHRLEEAVPSLNLVALNYFLAKYPRAKARGVRRGDGLICVCV